MDYWEFLLQQEGDQSWLPLDTAQVEILEGRYRIMAHSNQAHQPVQITINQLLPDRRTANRRSLTRQAHTNGEGLIVVLPFTRLEAGIWDIRCSGIEADALAPDQPTWAYGIQLRVLPQGSGEDDDWFADEGRQDPISELAPSSHGTLSAPTPIAIGAGFRPEDLETALNQAQRHLASGMPLPTSAYSLVLRQSALAGQDGEAIEVRGDIVTPQGPTLASQMALVVRLIDPQTTSVVALSSFPWVGPNLPTPFNLPITLPTGLSTRLLLGELALVTNPENQIRVLALERFTVTVNLLALFDQIANQSELRQPLNLDFASQGSGAEAEKDDRADSIHLPPPRSVPFLTLPRSGLPLPPQIYYPSEHEINVHRPSLPAWGRPPEPDPVSSPEADLGGQNRDLTLPPITPPRPAAKAPQPLPPETAPRPLLPSHEALGFRDLKWQERFWSRLNQLAADIQQEAKARRAAAPDSKVSQAAAQNDSGTEVAFAGEVVIYEDETAAIAPTTPPAQATAEALASPPQQITPSVPHLDFAPGEWVAGQSIRLRVRLPLHPNRLYIKVWITDPQTRQLVGPAQSVQHLFPNGRGELEGSLSLEIPLGCLEAEVEAIAVDLQTHQESHKASQRFSIIPSADDPNPP
ncbi:MAG: hypothetical protein KGQ93_09750 [Cyanobacteria bacterium REEB459]|nr:hypothetical protein [Cyanobacteria bacterium REEB459]